jgi:hypothetical protein
MTVIPSSDNRHQLAVLQRTTPKRPRLRRIDRLLWILVVCENPAEASFEKIAGHDVMGGTLSV